ncbi:MAG: creatininase family protein [Bacteroidota bacterium]
MPAPPYLLAEATWKTVRSTPYTIALLPWGATEAHNYHLPYATDTLQCDHIAAESARRAWAQGARPVVLPTVPFGVNTGQLDIKLDLNLNPSTQHLILRDLIHAISAQGIPKIAIMNGHGGNSFKQMLRQLQVEFPSTFLCTFNWYDAIDWSDFFEDLGDHAGEMETSLMLHILPDLVAPLSEAGPGRARQFAVHGLRERWVWAQRKWSEVTDDTGVGNPAQATAEKGAALFNAVCDQIAHFLIEFDAADINNMYEDADVTDTLPGR